MSFSIRGVPEISKKYNLAAYIFALTFPFRSLRTAAKKASLGKIYTLGLESNDQRALFATPRNLWNLQIGNTLSSFSPLYLSLICVLGRRREHYHVLRKNNRVSWLYITKTALWIRNWTHIAKSQNSLFQGTRHKFKEELIYTCMSSAIYKSCNFKIFIN